MTEKALSAICQRGIAGIPAKERDRNVFTSYPVLPQKSGFSVKLTIVP